MASSINEMLVLLSPVYKNFYMPLEYCKYYLEIIRKMERLYEATYPEYFETFTYIVSSTLIRIYCNVFDEIVRKDLSKINGRKVVEEVIRFCKDRFSTISGILPFLTPHFETHSERVYSYAKMVDLALRYLGGGKVLRKKI